VAKVLALCGQKGGTGKTTIAIHLACEWHRAGKHVLLVDLDSQGSTTTFSDVALELGSSIPKVVGMGNAVRTQVAEMSPDYDVVVIDCAGHNNTRSGHALLVADLALMPCHASPLSVWALSGSLDLVNTTVQLRDGALKARLVLNSVIASTKLSKEIVDALDNPDPDDPDLEILRQTPRLRSVIHERVAFVRSFDAGQGVTTFEPDGQASAEIRALAKEIESIW
jgi:chromosome partitioning protein